MDENSTDQKEEQPGTAPQPGRRFGLKSRLSVKIWHFKLSGAASKEAVETHLWLGDLPQMPSRSVLASPLELSLCLHLPSPGSDGWSWEWDPAPTRRVNPHPSLQPLLRGS